MIMGIDFKVEETADEIDYFDKHQLKIISSLKKLKKIHQISKEHLTWIGIRHVIALQKSKQKYSHFFEGKKMLNITEDILDPAEVYLLRKIISN
mmetsp:Transcript_30956/g.30606  ORF Transcript_30956/g.30606 Transcript_30956/m.30606 type:complete len:94 (+) Transcript_30956:1079-1360(+)